MLHITKGISISNTTPPWYDEGMKEKQEIKSEVTVETFNITIKLKKGKKIHENEWLLSKSLDLSSSIRNSISPSINSVSFYHFQHNRKCSSSN